MDPSTWIPIAWHEQQADHADRWSSFYRSNLDPCVQASADRFAGMAAGYRFRAREIAYDARGGMTEVQAERARLLGVLASRTVVTTVPTWYVRDYDDGLDWAGASRARETDR